MSFKLLEGQRFLARNKSTIVITGPHPKWPGVYKGRIEGRHTPKRWYWMQGGKYLHGVGSLHEMDLVKALGRAY